MHSVPRATSLTGYRDARALVFGASGFVGRWVARKLDAAGAKLTLVVRDEKAARDVFERYEVGGELRAADLMVPGSAASLVDECKPQVTFNLLGYGIDRRERENKPAWRLNYDVVREIAIALSKSAANDWGGTQFVHVGSAAEYGSAGGALGEDAECKPVSLYGRTKLLGTSELMVRADLVSIRAVAARLFTVYGPGETSGRLLPTLLDACQRREPIELTAGLQKRDFTYVEDAADGLLRLGLVPATEPRIVNLATGTLASVRSFTLNAAAVLGLPLDRLRFGARPTHTEEMNHDDVDIRRLRELVQWKPDTAIPDGVAKTKAFLEAAS